MWLGADLVLKIHPKNSQQQIPPAIFHTLLENAFSHNNYASGKAVFKLDILEEDSYTRYQFSAPTVGTGKAIGTGTGTKYVQARLREFCGKNFTFASEQIGSDWVTTIVVPSNIN